MFLMKKWRYHVITEFRNWGKNVLTGVQFEKLNFWLDKLYQKNWLMAWREVGEVLPYYCEGLIHLGILFDSGIITYDNGQIKIDYSKYDAMKEAYTSAYRDLAENYLKKVDANEYLGQYAVKNAGVYLPKNEEIKAFVEHYYARYQEIGQQTVALD